VFKVSSGLESAILNFYFRSGSTVFPMFQLDRMFKDLSNDVLRAIFFAVSGLNPWRVVTTPSVGNVKLAGYSYRVKHTGAGVNRLNQLQYSS